MNATELYNASLDILKRHLGEIPPGLFLTVSCAAHGHNGEPSPTHDFNIAVIDTFDGREFHERTSEGSFIKTPQRSLELFETVVIPMLMEHRCISTVPEYDPIAMGA